MMYDLSFPPGYRYHNQPSSSQKLQKDNNANNASAQANEKTDTSLHYSGITDLAKKISPWQNAENTNKERIVNELRSIDAEVHAHEMAHLAAAGGAATSGPTYVYVTGPDGKSYAVGGEVGISLSSVPGNLEATIQKAQAIRNAALAPGDPSSQDLAVAAAASQMEMTALAELSKQRVEKMQAEFGSGVELKSAQAYATRATHAYSSSALHDSEPLIDIYA